MPIELTPAEKIGLSDVVRPKSILLKPQSELMQLKPWQILEQEVRSLLESYDSHDKQIRLRKLLNRMWTMAMDPKLPPSAALEAMKALLERGYRKPKSSDEEGEDKRGIIAVYMYNPELSDVPEGPAKLPEPKPDFIDAEFTQNDANHKQEEK